MTNCYYPKFRLKNLLKDIFEAFWTWRGGATQDALLEKSRRHFSEHVFSPLEICCAMDLFGGMLNFQALRVIHWVETDGKQLANCMSPSPAVFSRFVLNFTGFYTNFVNINFFTNKFGEGFEFNHQQVIKLIWEHTGKDLIAEERPTKVVLTADGSKLTNNINVVLMRLKETEAADSMPLIGSHQLKFSNNCDGEADGSLSVQSAFLSFPIMVQLGSKSGNVIDTVCKRKYKAIMEPSLLYISKIETFYCPLPSDRKFSWLATKAGSAAKVKKYFCQYCVTTSNDSDKANPHCCKYCQKYPDEKKIFPFPDVKWECLHHDFITESLIDRLREQLQLEYPEEFREWHRDIRKKK
jgi:hypothetical protein